MTLVLPQIGQWARAATQIEVVASSSQDFADNTTTSIVWPTGTADGDIVIITVASDRGSGANTLSFGDVEAFATISDVTSNISPRVFIGVLSYDAARSSTITTNFGSGASVICTTIRNAAGTTPGTVAGSAALSAIASQASGTLASGSASGNTISPPTNTSAMSGNAVEFHAAFVDDDNNSTVSQYALAGKTPSAAIEDEQGGGGANGNSQAVTCRVRTDTQALNANTGGVTAAQDWIFSTTDDLRSFSFSLEGD